MGSAGDNGGQQSGGWEAGIPFPRLVLAVLGCLAGQGKKPEET